MNQELKSLNLHRLSSFKEAKTRISRFCIESPLVRLNCESKPNIYLKLENLQPSGSFKIRIATNILLSMTNEELAQGVWTASTGNLGIALSWLGKRLGVKTSIVVHDGISKYKLDTMADSGASIFIVSYDEWWEAVTSQVFQPIDGIFIDSVGDTRAREASGTIALELYSQLPGLEAIFVPFGGGGSIIGQAAVFSEMAEQVSIIGCEAATSTPLAAALAAGKPVDICHEETFISGIGSRSVLPKVWPDLSNSVSMAQSVSLDDIANTIQLLAQYNRLIVEPAGAVSVAVALANQDRFSPDSKIVCILSGGNINHEDLYTIMSGQKPERTKE